MKPATTTVDDLWDALTRSGLLSAADMERAAVLADLVRRAQPRQGQAGENESLAQTLARHLVHKGLVTRWQAQRLLAGNHTFFLGKYKLLERLGAGGMGEVYKAEQCTIRRIVALKVLARQLLARPEAVRRFQREVRVAAALKHPSIVVAYDSGCIGQNHFLVMEFVEGRDLDKWLKQYGRMPVHWSCECIRQAAMGLEHAHQRGFVHRDIKPSNLLVVDGGPAGPPVVKILDLGLARLASDLESGDTELTLSGQILGTPDYIAPEQALNHKLADTRSDIFSLGCTLYKLLTGKLPYGGANPMEKLMARVAVDPPPASTLRSDIPPGLDVVLASMLARSPNQRYQTPAEVAAVLAPFAHPADGSWDQASSISLPAEAVDLGNLAAKADSALAGFLSQLASRADEATLRHEGRTTSERSAPGGGRGWPAAPNPKQVKLALAAAAAVLVVVLALGTLSRRPALLLLDWPASERRASTLYLDGRPVQLPLDGPLEYRIEPGEHTVAIRRQGYEEIAWQLPLARGDRVTRRPEWRPLDAARAGGVETHGGGHPPQGSFARREARRRQWMDFLSKLEIQAGATAAARQREFDELEDEFLARRSGGGDAAARAALAAKINAFRQRWPATPQSHQAVLLLARLASPLDQLDPHRVPVALALPEGGPAVAAVFGHDEPYDAGQNLAVALSADGSMLASCGPDHTVRLWDTTTFQKRHILAEHAGGVNAVAFSPDGKLLATAGSDQTAGIWDTQTGRRLLALAGHEGPVTAVAFSPDGKTVATAGVDKTLRLWGVSSGRQQALVKGHAGAVRSVVFGPYQDVLATASDDRKIRIWEVAAGDEWFVLEGHTAPVRAVAFSPDGKLLASAADDGMLYLWNMTVGQLRFALSGHSAGVRSAAFSPDGRTLASASADGSVRLWDTASGTQQRMLRLGSSGGVLGGVAYSCDGRHLAVAGGDGLVYVVRLIRQR